MEVLETHGDAGDGGDEYITYRCNVSLYIYRDVVCIGSDMHAFCCFDVGGSMGRHGHK